MHDNLGQEEANVSWTANPKMDVEVGTDGAKTVNPVILESMLFKDDAKDLGVVEVGFPAVVRSSLAGAS